MSSVYEEVTGALALVTSTIASPDVQGADALALLVAVQALRRATDALRPAAPFQNAGEVVQFPGFSVKAV